MPNCEEFNSCLASACHLYILGHGGDFPHTDRGSSLSQIAALLGDLHGDIYNSEDKDKPSTELRRRRECAARQAPWKKDPQQPQVPHLLLTILVLQGERASEVSENSSQHT